MFDGMPKEPMGIPATTVGKESEEYKMRGRIVPILGFGMKKQE